MKMLVHTRAEENCHVGSDVPTKTLSTLLASYRSETPLFQAPRDPSKVRLKFLGNRVFHCIFFNGILFSQLEQQSSGRELCLASHGCFIPFKAPMQFHCSHLHVIAVEENSTHSMFL